MRAPCVNLTGVLVVDRLTGPDSGLTAASSAAREVRAIGLPLC
jgi:hypothetical protein